uniref:Uncharacterized protein n=1 Tax=Rhizophora mucronata TaxID=61149 RepID=A0A2P2Q3A7_RHIMU
MKLSLTLQDDHHLHNNNNKNKNNKQHSLLKAKLPISVLNQPLTSIFTTTTTNAFSGLGFSLSTNFHSGPSLKLSYNLSSTATPISPFSLSLKSGLGLYGSPRNSPLVFSAHLSFSNTIPNTLVPTFSLHVKPSCGHFSIHKKTTSSSFADPNPKIGSLSTTGPFVNSGSAANPELGSGVAPYRPLDWQELKLESFGGKEKDGLAKSKLDCIEGVYADNNGNGLLAEQQLVSRDKKIGGFFSGVAVKAKTVLPLTKGFRVNLRWGVNLPGDLNAKMPYLTVNKISIERAELVKEVKEKSSDNHLGDVELLKGMSFWMRRDLEVLEKENRDMRQILEDIRMGASARSLREESISVGKKGMPGSVHSFSDFGHQRSKINDEDRKLQRESKRPVNGVTDLESELQRAIKAASA